VTGDSWLYVLGAVSLGFAFGLYCGMSVRRAPEPPDLDRIWRDMQPALDVIDARRTLKESASARALQLLN
jgi:hypothetical protein